MEQNTTETDGSFICFGVLIHPSINPSRITVGLEPVPADMWEEVGYPGQGPNLSQG